MELELALDPDDAGKLNRLPLLAPLRTGRTRSRAIHMVWHDSPERELAGRRLALVEQRPLWRLERICPEADEIWPPGAPAPVLASQRSPDALGIGLPATLIPVAAFEGRAASMDIAVPQGPVELNVLRGSVRAVAGEHRISRIRLQGTVDAVEALATALAGEIPLATPRACFTAEASALATNSTPPARREGAPTLPKGLPVGAAFAHVVGHLGDVILYLAPLAAGDGREGPEPVHQMRVAVRRLRSAIKVFRQAVRDPAVDAVDVALKALAAKLAPTRDWDVFVTETAVDVAKAFPDEVRLQRLMVAADRRRRTCHDELRAFLASADFRRLGIHLACLANRETSGNGEADPEASDLAMPLEGFAARVLSKRLKAVVRADDALTELAPAELHAIRLRAKRLRYAAEIFAPLYAGKAVRRFIQRLTRLQDRLGTLNDQSVAASLLGELPGGQHSFATGLVLGFLGAMAQDGRHGADKAWDRFRRLEPFWE